MEEKPVSREAGPRPSDEVASLRLRAALTAVLLLALAVRVFLLTHISLQHPEYLVQDLDEVETGISTPGVPYMNDFGFEASNIAYAWACDGQVYASPFGGATGPTAWIAPGIVLPYAISFALWGCFTPAAILFAYGMALVVSVVTTFAVFHIGKLISGSSWLGLLSAVLFAILPYEAWTFHTNSQLDFNLLVLWFALLLLAVLKTIAEPQRGGLVLGVTSSLAALFNPGFLLCSGIGFLLALPGRSARQRVHLGWSLVAVHLVLVGPYIAWQSARIGTFVPVKSNAPVELLIGNTDTASGLLRHQVFLRHHPSQNDTEFVHYSEVGEGAYVHEARHRFLESFRLGDFVENSVRRTHLFFAAYEVKSWDHSSFKIILKRSLWLAFFFTLVGLVVIRLGRPTRLETAALLFTLAYAFPYLLTGIMERYRIPITPIVAVSLAILVFEAWRRFRGFAATKLGL
jgi:hypothetical protein